MKNFKTKYADLRFDNSIQGFTAVLDGYITHSEFVELVEYEYEMVTFFALKKCLIDLRKMKLYAKGNEGYIENIWFPEMKKRGLKFVAFVVPESIFGEMSMRNAHKEFVDSKEIQTRHFKTPEEAMIWLKAN